jgi:hypothetical protein
MGTGKQTRLAFAGGPRDGQTSWATSQPPDLLIVDDSGGRYRWRDGAYCWES